MAVNLSKGHKIDLSKDGKSVSRLRVGLGWDEAEKGNVGFFGSLFGGKVQDIDCDASIICLNNDGMLVSQDINNTLLFYGNTTMFNGGLFHHGDNLTGAGSGDSETIDVMLEQIPDRVARLIFVVNIYQARQRHQHFGMIKNCYIRIVNMENNEEMCRFNLSENYDNMEGMIVAEIYRYKGAWKFGAIGEAVSTASDLSELISWYMTK